jgi:hypothetical protein
MCVLIYIDKCSMQHVDNSFNKFKMDELTHVKMLIVQEMWKFSLNHSSIIVKYWVAYVLIYYNNCKILFVNNGFHILKMNSSTLIIEEMWKKSLIHYNINVGFLIVTCVLINYGNYKMQLLSNDFNILKVDGSTHVPCW